MVPAWALSRGDDPPPFPADRLAAFLDGGAPKYHLPTSYSTSRSYGYFPPPPADHDVVHAGIEAWCRSAVPPIELAGSFTNPDDVDPAALHGIDVVILDLQFREGRPDLDVVRRFSAAGRLRNHTTWDAGGSVSTSQRHSVVP